MKRTVLFATISAFLAAALPLLVTPPAEAQESPVAAVSPSPAASPSVDTPDTELGESSTAVHELKAVSPKILVFVFDVSGSMRGKMLQRTREATINIIREATQPGDRVVLITFGSDYKQVFDKTLATEAEKQQLITQIPNKPEPGEGTNIRKPHHEALKLLEQNRPTPGAVVLLTDSYNDEPNKTDPVYATYLQYYLPGGRLKKYPDTPENRDYERLLREMTRSEKFKIFGIGVQIDSRGRPIERLPQADTPTDSGVGASPAPVVVNTVTEVKKDSLPMPLLFGGGVLLLALLAGLVYFLQSSKPIPLRIVGGPGGKKDFDLRPGQSVAIGSGSEYSVDAYALPELKGAAALIRGGSGGRMTVTLPPVQTPGVVPPKVFHNGLPLDKETPLSYGDEVRIALPDASGIGIQKEYRLKFDDPTKSF